MRETLSIHAGNIRVRRISMNDVVRSRCLLLPAALRAALGTALLMPVARAAEPERPALEQLRYEEDWSSLRDPARRTHFLDAVKFLSLESRGHWVLTIGGEVRQRLEWFHNTGFGTGVVGPRAVATPAMATPQTVITPVAFDYDPQDGNGYLLQRYMLHADLHLGEHVRLFAQVKSNLEHGRNGGPRVPDENEFDLHQLFADVKLKLPFGLGRAPGAPANGKDAAPHSAAESSLTLRGGRQELNYGSSRLITFREGPNVRLSFDAARVIFETNEFRADAFYARPVEVDRYGWDDQAEDSREVYGIYTVTDLGAFGLTGIPPGAKPALDLYYLGYENDDAQWDEGAGHERRHSFGARLAGEWRNFDWNFEAVAQTGTFYTEGTGRGEIRAWTVASDSGYTFSQLPLKPRLALKANIASGDDEQGDGDLNTFNALFPKGSYFGESGIIGPYNIANLHPYLELKFTDQVTFTAEAIFFWRESLADGIYNPPGELVRPSSGSRERFIGTQFNVIVDWEVTPRLGLEARYERFEAGPFIADTGPSGNVDYAALTLQFKF